jgi:hypothetical protein
MNINVDYMAVIVAAVVSMVIGFLWYGQLLFGKPWMKLMGYTPESLKTEQQKMGMYYGLSFVLSLVTAYILFHVMTMSQDFYGLGKLQTALTSAFWMWLGFILPVQATGTIFSKDKSFKLLGINAGYQLASILGMGVVIGVI